MAAPPSPIGTWKWNVDGLAKGKPGPTGIGGVLRDSGNNIIVKFAASVGIRDSNEVEFMVLGFALELLLKKKVAIMWHDSRIRF